MKKHSKFWKLSKVELQKLLDESTSINNLFNKLDMSDSGASRKILYERIKYDDLSLDQLNYNRTEHKKNISKNFLTKNIDEYLQQNIKVNGTKLKQKLISHKLLEDKCSICGILPVWNNQKLNLQLDHINGDHRDNRLNNLRVLCPNCHSQTDTFCGKNIVKKPKQLNKCINCQKGININAKRCVQCSALTKQKFIASKEELVKLVKTEFMTTIAKIYNVSDNAIRKRCRKLGINPNTGDDL